MKWSSLIGIIVVMTVVGCWVFLIRTTMEHPELMPSLSGCYLPAGADQSRKIDITTSGSFRYQGKLTDVVPYKDKGGLAFLPKRLIVVGSKRRLEFRNKYPLLIRIDNDKRGFIVSSETGPSMHYRKSDC